ncbi:MAG: hypothetical protein ACRBBR_00640 [Cellvibrionaceae bacterium]
MLTATAKTAKRAALGLRYFSAEEFGVYYPVMSLELLTKLDQFRHEWGGPVEISKAVGGIGREDESSQSQHNVLRWGEVRAVDVFPRTIDGYITTRADRQRALYIARKVGFTGIGIYTDTKQGNMLHLDVRQDRSEGSPALWSRVNGNYLGIDEVLV